MPAEIRVPEQIGESIVEATVGRWRKREGEPVSVGETVVELETDKVNLEIAAEQSGVISKILKPEGETVGLGEPLATVEAGDAVPSDLPRPAEGAQPDSAQLPRPAATEPAAPGEEAEDRRVKASPLAERVADDLEVPLDEVPATGPGGKVVRTDVEAYARTARAETRMPPGRRPDTGPAPAPTPAPAVSSLENRGETRQRLSRRRLTIAKRLVEAQRTAAMLTTFNEVDMTAVMDIRARRKEEFKERHGVGLGFMSFFTKAVVGALKAFASVNAELQNDELILKQYYDIGVAIGDAEGLVVPVVRDADKLTFAGIEARILEPVQKAKEKTLTLEELRGGTFTITNGGVFGSLLSTPILNPPQVGILGMHKIEQRPVALHGEVVIRPMMYLALSYDHRVVDGREAVQFLVRVKELIEEPDRIMLEG
jgi:2-oxoglutarate dehydrogenase E2 component (dihydrolipoamide succinyltransferase)